MSLRQLFPPFASEVDPVNNLSPTLPAAYPCHNDDGKNSIVRQDSDSSSFVHTDLDISRLNMIYQHLWWAGRPTSARALHRQKMIDREIVITEQADLHLVWYEARMFIKPLPDYLLSHQFWEQVICKSPELYSNACGFLLSYIWLVCHQSDLKIAIDIGLVSSQIKWEKWVTFVDSVLTNIDMESLDGINMRYHYGELRLNRLNQIYRLKHIFQPARLIQGYMYSYNRYATFFNRNFGWVLLIFIYMTIILTALQVGLATDLLQQNTAFQQASYGFAVFSLLSPLIVVVVAAILFLLLFFYNLITTRTFLRMVQHQRLQHTRSKSSNEIQQ